MERSNALRNLYRWKPVCHRKLDEDEMVKKLKEEERQLDAWIKMNTEEVEGMESYITSQHLVPLLDEDSTTLAIATPRKCILHLPHALEQQHDPGHHIFTLIPPKTHGPRQCTLPKVFLLESGESMRPLSLVPPPPLLEKCCSDFTSSTLYQFLQEWDDASEEAKPQDVIIKPHCSFEVKNETQPFQMIKDNNKAAMPVTEVFSSMSHALLWDAPAMNHALVWDSHCTPHGDATKKAPQGLAVPHHRSWEEQMAEQLPMPTLLDRESSGLASLVFCDGA